MHNNLVSVSPARLARTFRSAAFSETRQPYGSDADIPQGVLAQGGARALSELADFSRFLATLENGAAALPWQRQIGAFVDAAVSLPEEVAADLLGMAEEGGILAPLRHHFLRIRSELDKLAVTDFVDGNRNSAGFRAWVEQSQASVTLNRSRNVLLNDLRLLGDVSNFVRPDESIAFVSENAVPISAALLHQKTGFSVTAIDFCEDSVDLSARLAQHLQDGRPGKRGLKTVHARPDEFDYTAHPVVIIAASVKNKAAVLDRIEATGGDVAVIRCGEGGSALLFEPFYQGASLFGDLEFQEKATSDGAYNASLLYARPEVWGKLETDDPQQIHVSQPDTDLFPYGCRALTL